MSEDRIQNLLQRLEKAQGDTRIQSALIAEFAIARRPDLEQGSHRVAVDAAAVLHWFDAELLRRVLEISG
jgi:hypothetical protein